MTLPHFRNLDRCIGKVTPAIMPSASQLASMMVAVRLHGPTSNYY